MPNTYSQIYLQIIFAVKYRNASLDKKWRTKIFAIIGNLINESGCKTIIINGVEDHVHCFLVLKPSITISELVKGIKSKSSKYINDHNFVKNEFHWQEGYAVFSYSQSQKQQVCTYIENQEIHHKALSFIDEYVDLLKMFDIRYDEKYLFYEPL